MYPNMNCSVLKMADLNLTGDGITSVCRRFSRQDDVEIQYLLLLFKPFT